MDTSDDPNWITTYRGLILVKQIKKWAKQYKARRGGLQLIAILEEIIEESFSHKPCDSLGTLWERLRDGGFTIPFIKSMQKHFKYVSETTQTDENIPLSMTAKDWALAILIEQMNQKFLTSVDKGTSKYFGIRETEKQKSSEIKEMPVTSTDTNTSTSAPRVSQIAARTTEQKMSESKETSIISAVPAETDDSILAPNISSQSREKGKQTRSKSSKTPSKSVPLEGVSYLQSSSSNTSQSMSVRSRCVQSESAARFLTPRGDDLSSRRVWKGISETDLSTFQLLGNRWDRSLRRRGGDLSVAPANYYSNSRRYALAWAAYRLDHRSWANRNLDGSIILESELGCTDLSKLVLPNNPDVQRWMTSNIESAWPLDSCRTCPPGTSNSHWDIIWGPIRDGDVDEEPSLHEVSGLAPSLLRRIEQVAFCTNAAVAYNNAMHSQVIRITHDGSALPGESDEIEREDRDKK